VSLDVRGVLWSQLGGAIDMLENAIRACPPTLWGDRTREPEYWYIVYHTLFFLDYTLADSREGFMPPEPYNLDELDPTGVLPPRVYSQEEMLVYLEHGRHKCASRCTRSRRSVQRPRVVRCDSDGRSWSCASPTCGTCSTTPRNSTCCCARMWILRRAG